MKKIIISVFFFVIAASLSLILFSKDKAPVASFNTEANAVQSPKASSGTAALAPDFSLPTLNGGTIRLSDYRGKKPVVLDFWASWCPNCRRDMPTLNRYYEKYKDRVEVIGINLQESENDVRNFVEEKNILFPIALDLYGEAANLYRINYTNFHMLIDVHGNITGIVPGDIHESDILPLLQ